MTQKNEIMKFLDELHQKMQKEKEFAFWEYLKKAKGMLEGISEENKGKIEKNVIVEGKVSLGKNSVIKSGTRIEGTVFIGENCVVGPNAFLRGFVILEGKNTVANSELKNVILMEGSNAPHYSYVGDSLIGKNCNLGAGTKIANLRFDNKNVRILIRGKEIDSGERKLGCLMHDEVKTGVNSGINGGVILYPDANVQPNSFVKGVVK